MYTITKYLTLIITMLTGTITTINTHGLTIPIKNNNDGLYLSTPNRYVYKGENPNNYLKFNNELWRIISFEPNNMIKIIKAENIKNIPFDENNQNNWETSTLNKYLNQNYYSTMPTEVQNLIADHSWNIGAVYKNQKSGEALKYTIEEEQEQTTNSKIGLISMSEYIEAMDNPQSCGNISLIFKNESKCQNYFDKIVSQNNLEAAWTISKDEYSASTVYYIGNTYFPDNMASSNFIAAIPVVYLNKNITLKGDGTESKPYEITKIN